MLSGTKCLPLPAAAGKSTKGSMGEHTSALGICVNGTHSSQTLLLPRIMAYNLQCSITDTWLLSVVTFCSKGGVGHQQSGNPCNTPHCTVSTNPGCRCLFFTAAINTRQCRATFCSLTCFQV